MATPVEAPLATAPARGLEVSRLYDEEAGFVYRTLHRMGVVSADLQDLLQETFVTVHRRRRDFDADRPVRPWLYGICLGLVRNYRRRASRRMETVTDQPPERVAPDDPDEALRAQRRRAEGERLLAELGPEKRAVFVMFEVEGMSGATIAEQLGLPLGTVHSRLHAARKELLAGLQRNEESST